MNHKILELIPKDQRICIVLMAMVIGAVVTSCVFNQAREQVAEAVTEYCTEYSPQDREAFRALLNNETKPNEVHIHCAGDPE